MDLIEGVGIWSATENALDKGQDEENNDMRNVEIHSLTIEHTKEEHLKHHINVSIN